MKTLDQIIADILRREGGFVHHPADRGGPTKFGITQKTLAAYHGRPVSVDEVRTLSRGLAIEIYQSLYVSGPRLHTLPPLLQPCMVDCAVHSGPRRAIRFLQEVLNLLGQDLQQDGAIGPKTRAAAEAACFEMGAWLVNAVIEQRRQYLRRLISADPSQQIFAKGWEARLAELELPLST